MQFESRLHTENDAFFLSRTHSLIAMSEAKAAIIKPGESPYVTVFVSDTEVVNEDSQCIDSQQIVVHAENNVAVEDFNDIHCVISQDNGNLESSENEDITIDTNRTLWTRNNVKLLIDEYKAMKQEFQDPRRKQKALWATLATRLCKRISKEDKDGSNSWMTSQMTWDTCDRKWRNLKHTFKTIHTNQWRSFRSRSRWEFYNPLLDIFGDSVDCRQPNKVEGTRYVVVHPPFQDGNKAIVTPGIKKPTLGIRQAQLSQLSTLVNDEEGDSGDETVFVEEVKVDENTGGSYVVVKPTKESSSEPKKKRFKFPQVVHHIHGQIKAGDVEDAEILNANKECGFSPMEVYTKLTKDESNTNKNSECVVESEGSFNVGDSPPLWFVNFYKEYQAEEKIRRETLRKAHEDIIRVEERKVRALENILNKLSSSSSVVKETSSKLKDGNS